MCRSIYFIIGLLVFARAASGTPLYQLARQVETEMENQTAGGPDTVPPHVRADLQALKTLGELVDEKWREAATRSVAEQTRTGMQCVELLDRAEQLCARLAQKAGEPLSKAINAFQKQAYQVRKDIRSRQFPTTNPDDEWIQIIAADAKGDTPKAIAGYRAFAARYPDDPRTPQAVRRLETLERIPNRSQPGARKPEEEARAAIGRPDGTFAVNWKDTEIEKVAATCRRIFGELIVVDFPLKEKKVTLSASAEKYADIKDLIKTGLERNGVRFERRGEYVMLVAVPE